MQASFIFLSFSPFFLRHVFLDFAMTLYIKNTYIRTICDSRVQIIMRRRLFCKCTFHFGCTIVWLHRKNDVWLYLFFLWKYHIDNNVMQCHWNAIVHAWNGGEHKKQYPEWSSIFHYFFFETQFNFSIWWLIIEKTLQFQMFQMIAYSEMRDVHKKKWLELLIWKFLIDNNEKVKNLAPEL